MLFEKGGWLMRDRACVLKVIAVLACVSLAAFVDSRQKLFAADDSQLVTISAGQEGGVYYPAAGVICRLLHQERERHGIRCAVDLTQGSVENVENLTAGRSDMGIVQTDVQFAVVNRLGDYATEPDQTPLRSLFSLHAESVTIVSRLDAKVNEFRDLMGKRVNVGEVGSGSFATANALMQAFGMSTTDLRRQMNSAASEAATALCENQIDAMILVVGHPNRAVKRVSESCAVKLVPVNGPVVDELLALKPYFSNTTIPAGTYIGQDEDVQSLGVRASVLTTQDLPDNLAYEVTRAVVSNNELMRRLHPAFATLDLLQMVQGNTAPWHPGALKYFNERGLLSNGAD